MLIKSIISCTGSEMLISSGCYANYRVAVFLLHPVVRIWKCRRLCLLDCDVKGNLALDIEECTYCNLFSRIEIGRSVTLLKAGLNNLKEQCH
jgi:hypothetical protein